MAKKGLNRDTIVETAAQLAEEKGIENLTLHELADTLGVKTASLYNHLQGLPELNARLTERAFRCLLNTLEDAIQDREGIDAVRAMADAYLNFAREKPQLYKSTLALPQFQGETELQPLKEKFKGFFHSLLTPCGLSEEEQVHYSRSLRSAIHGFVSLEGAGFFSNPVDPQESYRHMIDDLCSRIQAAGNAHNK